MADAIERAFIEIFADASSFDEDLKKSTERALARAQKSFATFYDDLDTGGKRAVNAINRSFSSLFNNGRVPGADDIIDKLLRMERHFETLGPAGREAFQEMVAAARRAEPAIVDGPSKALRDLSGEADRFGNRIRASLGRAAVVGVEDLEASITDLTATGRREFLLFSEQVKRSLSGLGNVPGLERLEEQFESITTGLQIDFSTAVARVAANLDELQARGELTTDELRQQVSQLAVLFDQRLGEAIDEVGDDLRRLSGDSNVFREQVREVERWTDEIIQGNRALNKTGDEMRRVAKGADDSTREILQFGRAAARASKRADQGFGRFVASLNRMRFLVLDARFLITGLGVFAAAQFARLGIEATSEIEQVRLSFQTIAKQVEGNLGDSFDSFAGRAEVSLGRVIEFARETPFAITDVADAVRRISAFLPSFQIADPEDLDTLNERTTLSLEIFKDLGGALAVLGQQDALPRLVKALGDVGAAGKLTGEEVRQLRNALPGVNIREAIITGIFDPTIEASDSIIALREEFSRLGADAEQAPVAATAAFVELQRRGLITTDAVVQGLRSTLRNLAGEEALENFTLTIQGSMEKVRESIEVGLFRGLEDLGPVLVDNLLPALGDIETASTRFGAALSDLAEASLPLLVDGFIQLTDLGGAVFELMADFAQQNAPLIERTMDELTDVSVLLADAFFDITASILPLIPVGLELTEVFLSALVPVLDAALPVLRLFTEALDALPPEVIATTIVFLKLNTAIKASGGLFGLLVAFNAHLTRLGGAMKALKAIGPLPILGVAGGLFALFSARRNRFIEEGASAVDALTDSFSNLADVPLADVDETAAANLGVLVARLVEVQDELDALNDRNVLDRFGADLSGESSRLIGELNELREAIGLTTAEANLIDQNLAIAGDVFGTFADGLSDAAREAFLADDAIAEMLAALGFGVDDLQQPLSVLIPRIREAIDGVGGLAGAADAAGIALPQIKGVLADIRDPAEDIADAFANASSEFQRLTDLMLAQTDPFFALALSQQEIAEANAELAEIRAGTVGEDGDFATQAEKDAAELKAVISLAKSGQSQIKAFSDVLGAVADEEVGASLEGLEDILNDLLPILGEQGPAAMDLLIESIETVISESLPDVAEALGITGDSVSLLETAIREGAQGMLIDFDDLGEGATVTAEDIAEAFDGIDFDGIVTGFDIAARDLEDATQTALSRLVVALNSNIGDLEAAAFALGLSIFDLIQSGLLSRNLAPPTFTGTPGSGQAAPTFNPDGSGLSPGSGRTVQGGLTVNQTINTSDPAGAGRESVRQFSNEIFLQGLN